MNYQGPRYSFLAANLKSAIDNPMAVNIKISQELNLDRIAGPFDQPPFEHIFLGFTSRAWHQRKYQENIE